MKSFREFITEGPDRNGAPKKYNKNLYAKMVHHARGHISAVADDIEHGVQTTARILGKHEAGSVYHGVEDHLADHLHDQFSRHPGFSVGMARHVSKKITSQYIHDDRPEYRAAVKKHDRQQAAAARPPRVKKERVYKSASVPTSVNIWTKSGTVQRTMKMPPFRKA